MNAWLLAAAVLMVMGLVPCGWMVSRSSAMRRLIALNLSGTLAVAILMLLAQGYGRSSYVDLALVAALLGPVGTLVFTRLLRELPASAEPAQLAASAEPPIHTRQAPSSSPRTTPSADRGDQP